MNKKLKRRAISVGVLILLLLISGSMIAVLQKKIKINQYIISDDAVQGIDVSHYQGKIDWQEIQGQHIDFAFIKATEGSQGVDEQFNYNWQEAAKTEMVIGAYHFFSYDSPGERQAQHFIDTVGELSGKMAPVVDVEFYGGNSAHPVKKKDVLPQLDAYLVSLETYYGVKPIIYTTYKGYYLYIKDHYEGYPLWIRNVYYPPYLDIKNNWCFWQYTDTDILAGYHGEQKYIDRNVFNGDRKNLEGLIILKE